MLKTADSLSFDIFMGGLIGLEWLSEDMISSQRYSGLKDIK